MAVSSGRTRIWTWSHILASPNVPPWAASGAPGDTGYAGAGRGMIAIIPLGPRHTLLQLRVLVLLGGRLGRFVTLGVGVGDLAGVLGAGGDAVDYDLLA